MEVATGSPSIGKVQGVGGLRQRDVGPVGQGLAHVDRGQATARVARLQDAAIRADGEGGPVAHLHLMARDAACGVAAGRREGPVGVVEDKPEVGLSSGSITASWSKPTPR
jgi:hypothetical protein